MKWRLWNNSLTVLRAAQALRTEAERKALDLRARLAAAQEEMQEWQDQQALAAADADMAGHADR